MDATETFDVVVLGFDDSEEAPEARLQRAFGIEREPALQIIARLPATVQRAVSRVRADYFSRALVLAGAHVEIRDECGRVVAVPALQTPSAPEPAAAVASMSIGPAATLVDAVPPAHIANTMPAPGPAGHATLIVGRPASLQPPERASTNDTAFDLRPPAHPTVREGSPIDEAPQPSIAAPPPIARVAAAPVALWPPRDPSSIMDAPARAAALEPAFATRDPSSVWDAPPSLVRKPAPVAPVASIAPPASVAPPAVHRSAPPPLHALEGLELNSLSAQAHLHAHAAKLDGYDIAKSVAVGALWRPQPVAPAAARALTLDDEPASGALEVLSPWEQARQESMAEPSADHARDAARLAPAPRARAAGMLPSARPAPNTRETPSARAAGHAALMPSARALPVARANGAAIPVASRRPAPPQKPSVGVPERDLRFVAQADLRSFWESIPDALLLPFTGSGPYWICAVGAWSVVAAGLLVLAITMPFFPFVVPFFALSALLAFACDYYRTCLWVPATSDSTVDRAPTGDPVQLFQRYVKSGVHVTLFLLLSLALAILRIAKGVDDGASIAKLVSDRTTWALLTPYLYWPMAVGLTALGNDFAAIWNVPAGLRAVARAPLEYAAIVCIGLLTMAASWGGLLLAGRALFGMSPMLMVATLGLPLALSHGIQGALMGHLVRARGEVFE